MRLDRPAGRGEQPQDAPAFRASEREARDDDVPQRTGQRRAGELASRREELLRDERIPAGSLCDEQQHGRRRPLALDPGHDVDQLVAAQRRELDLGDPGARLEDRVEAHPEGMANRQLFGLVGRDEAELPGLREACEEGDKRAGRCVGVVEVLEDQHDRTALAEPRQDAEDALEGTALASLDVGDRRAGRIEPERLEASGQGRHDPGQLIAARSDDTHQVLVAEALEQWLHCAAERSVRRIRAVRRAGTTGPSAPAEDRERLIPFRKPAARLVEEPGDAEAARPADEERRGPTFRGRLEDRGETGEFTLTTDEPRARERRRHMANSRDERAPPRGDRRRNWRLFAPVC